MVSEKRVVGAGEFPIPCEWSALSATEQGAVLTRELPDDSTVEVVVRQILEDVAARGVEAVLELGLRFDGVEPEPLLLGPDDFDAALANIPGDLRTAMERAAGNLRTVAEATRPPASLSVAVEDGLRVTERTTALRRVGAYVPGGKAAYPSSVLMAAVPAKAAGVAQLIVASPPGPSGRPPDAVLAACALAGVDQCLVAGGAQAIAALAYGIEGLSPVHKIVGPGNRYVTAAKRLVYGRVDIDSPAGPSEVVLIADETTNPRWAALDLIAQAEHSDDARCIVATADPVVAAAIAKSIAEEAPRADRHDVIHASLSAHGRILLFPDDAAVAAFVSTYAPEHLQIMSEDVEPWLNRDLRAAAIFVGNYTPVPAGDYLTGANHVLPTGATATWASPLSVHQFLVRSTVQQLEPEAARGLAADLAVFARAEGLPGHAASMLARKEAFR